MIGHQSQVIIRDGVGLKITQYKNSAGTILDVVLSYIYYINSDLKDFLIKCDEFHSPSL